MTQEEHPEPQEFTVEGPVTIPHPVMAWYDDTFDPIFEYLEREDHIPDAERVKGLTLKLRAGKAIRVTDVTAVYYPDDEET